jgi:hypothetical protein
VGICPAAGGWELAFDGAGTGYQVVVDDVATSPVHSLQLVGAPSWAADAVKPFYSDATVIGFEVSVRVEATSGLLEQDARVGFWRREAWNIAKWYTAVAFRGDGVIRAGGLDLQAFTAGVWYKVTVTYDRAANVYSVWIDDVLRGENLAGPTHSSPYSVEALALSGRDTGARTTYDDVTIFDEGGPPPPPPTDTRVRVVPGSIEVDKGQEFTVRIEVTAVENLYGLDVHLQWDTDFLGYVSHTVTIPVENSTHGLLHEPVIVLKDEVNQAAGTYWIAVTSIYPASAFTGNGTVFEMTFEAKAYGTSSLDIISSDLADFSGQPITHGSVSGTVQISVLGDVDGDNDVDIFDLVKIASKYGCDSEDPRFDPDCDVDCDCDIDIYDIVLAAGNYGTVL